MTHFELTAETKTTSTGVERVTRLEAKDGE